MNLIYYDLAHEPVSYHLTRAFENSLAFHRQLFNYTPNEPITVLLQDFGDYGHGGASTVPWNYVSIGIEPFDYVYETMPANERMNWLMHHELLHVVETDQAADRDRLYRRLFRGKVTPIKEQPLSMVYSYLTSPRWYSPRWYHEGIAVFFETWMAGGLGRVLGGYDEMVFRTMALNNAYFYDVVGLESEGTTIDFQVGQNAYLYGTRFMTHLGAQYGPEKLVQWVNRTPGSRRYFASQFEKVYGVPLATEWRRWIDAERDWQKKNLELIRQYPVTAQKTITKEVLGSVSRTFHDPERNLLYTAVARPAKPASIVSIDVKSGKITPLAEVISPSLYFVTSIAYEATDRKIFFTSNNSHGWRTINELDLENGQTRVLLPKIRTGDLVVNRADQSLWGVQHHNGFSSLVRIPKPYAEWKRVLTLEYGRDIFDLDISPNGKTLISSMIDVTGRQQLIKLDIDGLLAGKSTIDVLHEFENNAPQNFTFSHDGRYLFGTSYYTGVSNVFRYDLQERKMEALTNVESGLFRPIQIGPDKLLAYRYTEKGFDPVILPIETREDINAIHYLGQQVVEKHPIVKSWNAGSPARVNLDKVTKYLGVYKPLAQTRLTSLYPVVEGYKDLVTVGMRFNLADPLALGAFDLTAAVTASSNVPTDERFHLKASYQRAPWTIRFRHNATDFYDLFGPTRTSRKGQALSVSFHKYLLYEKPKTLEYTISAAGYAGLDTLPDYQNVSAPFTKYATIGAHIDYADLRRTIGAVDIERGTAASIAVNGNYVNSDFFPRLFGTWDLGFLTPIPHSSVWFRSSAGKSWGDRDNPFANFFFGGFGNNWVDYRNVLRFREYTSFPGVELNEIGGADFVRGMVEWTLPPIRFEKLGVPAFYSNWLRFSLFASGIETNIASSRRRGRTTNIGAQADLSLVAFSSLDSTLSVGYARAYPRGSRSSDEFMISLKLLK